MRKNKKKFEIMNYFSVLRVLVAMALSLVLVFIIIFFTSDAPVLAISKLILGPFQTKRSFFNVIERAVPLIFTGLSLNVMLRSGVFNIGADGSFYMGAVIAAAIALKADLPGGMHQFVLILAAAVAGGVICMLPVLIQKLTKVDATVLSIMLNSIFYFFGMSIVSSFLLDNSGSWGSARFPASAALGNMISGTSMHWGVLILVFVILFVVVLMEKTSFGYKVRVTGLNPNFARTAGIRTAAVVLSAQFIGGAIAGMGGAIEMVGMYKRFQWQSPVNYVWDGLLVHMLANGNPAFIPLTSLFIAFLRIGAEIMSRATDLDPEVVTFLQGIIILLVASERFLYRYKERHDQKQSLAVLDKGGQA